MSGAWMGRVLCGVGGKLGGVRQLSLTCAGGQGGLQARFKMKIISERLNDSEEQQQQQQKQISNGEMDKEEEPQGYLKSHPYRLIDKGWKSKSELAKLLVDNVIHNDHGLFITNKPFGVGVRNPCSKSIEMSRRHGDSSRLHLRGLPTCNYTLEDLVPELRHLLNKPELVLGRSTEKLTSGPAIFCDNPATAERLTKRVASSKLHFDTLYKYHIISVLPPLLDTRQPSKVERIGITIKRGFDTEVGTPVLLRHYSRNSVKRRYVVSVHVQAQLLKYGLSDAGGYLVEVNTSAVRHNFLRVFLADKLAPILGDNLYSSRVQTVKGVPIKVDPSHCVAGQTPQKLSASLRECLNLKREEDSLMVPLHVHLRSYKLRGWIAGNRRAVLEIEAPYPDYYQWTCKQLGIVLDVDTTPEISGFEKLGDVKY